MKPILLKTLAAASLAATAQAEVHVMGPSWKERGVNAPLGTIIPNPGTVAATRGYLIMDNTVLTATPTPATYIEYGEMREAGVVTRYYTVDTDFTAFLADGIFGDSGGRRLYGHMHVPVQVSDVANPMIPFTGTTFSSGLPRKLSFDQTAFQTGASDTATGPQIVMAGASTLRSLISGSANQVKVSATTISDATDELVARLVRQGYSRVAGEAPEIVTDLPATLQLQDGEQATLAVTLDPDVFPGPDDTFSGPTYQWFKDDVALAGQTGPSLTITGGAAATGAGTYKVAITNEVGSATSGETVVTPETTTFTTNLPASDSIVGANSKLLAPVISPTPITPPTYQWSRSATAGGTFTPIATALGGTNPSLLVIGGEPATGAGFYRLDVTTSAGTISSTVCNMTVTAAAANSFAFTANLPRTRAVAFDATSVLSPTIPTGSVPAVASKQWFKAPLNDPTNFTAIAAGDGGTGDSFTVSGDNADLNGPGVYRMVATSTTSTTLTTVDCTITTAP